MPRWAPWLGGLVSIGILYAVGSAALRLPTDFTDAPYEGKVKVGKSYSYELSTHCGVEWTRLSSAWWRTQNLGGIHAPDGWGGPTVKGTMRLTSATTAEFRWKDRPTVVFTRTDEQHGQGCA